MNMAGATIVIIGKITHKKGKPEGFPILFNKVGQFYLPFLLL
tara:strand:+ start:537 stop:662 length:126 start_codon:yes stop_codon:yes gene_type:complete